MTYAEPGFLSDFFTTIQEKETGFPKMLPRWLPKSETKLDRCFTSTKCKKVLNEKKVYKSGRILTIKGLSGKKTFERLSIVFCVLPN